MDYNKQKDFNLRRYKFHWLYKKFLKHCDDNGIKLTNDDIKFIKRSTELITNDVDQTRFILYEYFVRYRDGMLNEPNEIKQQNTGRYKANTWLRELLDGEQ